MKAIRVRIISSCHHLFGFPKMAKVIIFVERNRIHVDPKFGVRGKFIRDASTNFAQRNCKVIVRICLLLQIKHTEITKLRLIL
jgi:hypothetical protein